MEENWINRSEASSKICANPNANIATTIICNSALNPNSCPLHPINKVQMTTPHNGRIMASVLQILIMVLRLTAKKSCQSKNVRDMPNSTSQTKMTPSMATTPPQNISHAKPAAKAATPTKKKLCKVARDIAQNYHAASHHANISTGFVWKIVEKQHGKIVIFSDNWLSL